MATSRRPRPLTVLNSTGIPLVFTRSGSFIFPGTTREVEPDDPFAQALIAKGSLIVQEG